jgi:hypothetical protein
MGLLAAVILMLTLSPVHAAGAQEDGDPVRIERWDVSVAVQSNASLDIREEQVVRFGEGEFTNGSRSLSIRQFEGMTDVQVFVDGEQYTEADSGEPGTFFWQVRGPIVTINWFFPQTSMTTHTFTVLYTVVGAVEFDAGISNRLIWDAIPVDHRRPIDASRVTVIIPPEGEIDLEVPPVTYGVESDVTVTDESIVTFEMGAIAVGQGVRVEVYFRLPDEFAIPEPIELPGGDPNSIIGPRALLILEIGVFVATLVAVIVVWRRRKATQPPEG